MKLRTVAKILGGLITLMMAALLAAPLLISPDALKAQLVAQVKKATGRTLEIKGATSVTFFPTIAVSAEDVSLSNPQGFSAPAFVTFKKLSTGAQLKPLLQGELLINGIALDGAVINLEQNEAGEKNWEFTTKKIQQSADEMADAPQAQKKASSPIKRFALGDVTITDSTVTFLKPGAKMVKISGIDATLQGADANSPLTLEGNADYNGAQVDMALDIAKTKEFLNGSPSPLQAQINVAGASINFIGTAHMGDAMGAQGALNLSLSSLPKVMEWATGKKPSGALPQQIMLKSDMEYRGSTVSLSHASIKADSLTGEGGLNIDMGAKVPVIAGELVLGEVNLDTLMPASSSAKGSDAANAPRSEGWSTTPVDLSALKTVDAKLAMAFTSLKRGTMTVGASQVGVTIKEGALALHVKQMKLYEGNATGTITASPAGVGADLALTGVHIEPLMVALSGQSRLEGKTNLTVKVKATGTTPRAWVSSLNGNGVLSVRDGALKGLNIGQFLRNAKAGFLQKSDAAATDFSELNASYTIANGVLSNHDLSMKSPALRVAGSGTVNLPDKTINYRLLPTVAGTSKGQGGKDAVAGITVPLMITGAWSNPNITPDVSGMLQEGLKDPEALKANLKNIGATLKDYNSGDDLKRALLGGKKEAESADAPMDGTTSTTTPEAPLTKKQQREQMIQEGVGSLLKGF